jgi:3-hydroxybutyrate dehydrogenase
MSHRSMVLSALQRCSAGDSHFRNDLQRDLPGWVFTPLVQKQIDALAAREKLDPQRARAKLLGEKQPSLEFTIPEELGTLAVFLCSDAAALRSGVALAVDGGWLAR